MATKVAVHLVGKDELGMVCPLGLLLGIKEIVANVLKND